MKTPGSLKTEEMKFEEGRFDKLGGEMTTAAIKTPVELERIEQSEDARKKSAIINQLEAEIKEVYGQGLFEDVGSKGGKVKINSLLDVCLLPKSVQEKLDKIKHKHVAVGSQKIIELGASILSKKILDLFLNPLEAQGWVGKISLVLHGRLGRNQSEAGVVFYNEATYYLEVTPLKR